MITQNEFLQQFSFVWSMRHDLPDIMLCELEEIKDSLKDCKDDDFTEFAEWLNEVLRDEGFPPLFGE